MPRKRRSFSAEFKAQVVLELISGKKSLMEASREYNIKDTVLSRWKQEFVAKATQVFEQPQEVQEKEARIAELERKVGQQALEIDFLKGCLQRIEEQRMLQALTGSPRSTGRSRKK